MSMTMQQLVEAVQDAVLTVSGIRSAPDYLPDAPGPYPFVATFVREGAWNRALGSRIDFDVVIAVQMHIERKSVYRPVKEAMGYAESIPVAIINSTALKNAVVLNSFSFTFGPLSYGGTDTVGFEWLLGYGQIGV